MKNEPQTSPAQALALERFAFITQSQELLRQAFPLSVALEQMSLRPMTLPDGYEPLIRAMLAAGLDGLHAVQPSCRGMDLRALKARYGGQVLFNGTIDSHHVLIDGTPASVRQSVREDMECVIVAPLGPRPRRDPGRASTGSRALTD